jgi:hypothetical protein
MRISLSQNGAPPEFWSRPSIQYLPFPGINVLVLGPIGMFDVIPVGRAGVMGLQFILSVEIWNKSPWI